MSTSKKKPAKKAAATKPEVVAKPAVTTEHIKEKEYRVGDVAVCRYMNAADSGNIVRQYAVKTCWCKEDLANQPTKAEEILAKFKEELVKEGWFLSDKACNKASLEVLEERLDKLRHDIEYDKACVTCTIKKLGVFRNVIKTIRGIEFDRERFISEGVKIPDVLPTPDADWEVKEINGQKVMVIPNQGPDTREINGTVIKGSGLKSLAETIASVVTDIAKKDALPDKSKKQLETKK